MTVTHEHEVLKTLTTSNEEATIPGTSISAQWELITPELADFYLAQNTHNRKIRQRHLERLVDEMVNDRYHVNHQGVAFDETGRLLDGQHRLLAIKGAEKPQWLLVTRGLPAEAQVVVDQMSKRSASDFLGGKYTQAKTAALRILIATENLHDVVSVETIHAEMTRTTITQVHDAVDRYGDRIDRWIPLMAPTLPYVRGRIGPGAILAASAYYPDVAEDMLTALAKNAAGYPASHPAGAIIRWVGTGHVVPSVAAFVALKAWRARHFDMDLQMIRAIRTQTINLHKRTGYISRGGKLTETGKEEA